MGSLRGRGGGRKGSGLEEENCEFPERSCSKESELAFSFQLIILLEQFRLLERSIYIKISPSPSHPPSF